MRILFALLILSLFSCEAESSRNITGEYLGFWATTFWTINLLDSNRFEFTSGGHFGNTHTEGTYLVKGDTLFLDLNDSSAIAKWTDHETFLITKDSCLIDVETKYDYCKCRSAYHNSTKRAIGYPQLPYDSANQKSVVHQIVQKGIDQIEVKNKHDSTVYMAEYYQITKSNGYRFHRFGKEVNLLSQEELDTRNISSYIRIETLDLGKISAHVQLNIEPYIKTFNSTISSFKKEEECWLFEY